MQQKDALPPVNARWCRALATLAAVSSVAFLVVAVILWLVPDWAPIVARGMTNIQDQPITLTPLVRVTGLVCSLLVLSVLCWGFWTARRLFLRLADGAVFEPETGVLLRRLGKALLWYAILTPFVATFMSWLVTHLNAPGQRFASFGISDQEITLAILGTLLVTLGSVMAQAAQIAEDHRQIV
jgi:hypothetical protein